MYKCLKHYAGIDPKHPQTIGSTTERRIWSSRALYLQRQTRHRSESSNGCSRHRPQSVVLIVSAKKGTWLHLQFIVEKCKTQIFKNVWIDGSASGDWRPCDTGLRSLALVSWRGLRIAHSIREASEAADTLQDWKTSFGTTSNCTYGPWREALTFRLN